MELKNAPFGRLAIGVLALNMLMTIAPPLTLPVQLTAALSTLNIPTLAVTVQQPQLDYSAMSWKSCGHTATRTQSGTMLTCAMKGPTSSCMVATL